MLDERQEELGQLEARKKGKPGPWSAADGKARREVLLKEIASLEKDELPSGAPAADPSLPAAFAAARRRISERWRSCTSRRP